jgi:hypothetical protein
MVRPGTAVFAALLLLAAPAWAAPELRADRAAMEAAMAAVDCAGSGEMLVGLADDMAALQPALDALGARVMARFEGAGTLLVAGDAGALRWLAASPLVDSLHLVATARDREGAILRRIAERDGAVRVVATMLPDRTDAVLTALGDDGVTMHHRMATTPQATLELTPAALDRLLALPDVCGLAEDRLTLGN